MFSDILVSSLKALAVTLAAMLVFLLIFAYICCQCGDPDALIPIFSIAICMIGGVAAGISGTRFDKDGAVLASLLCIGAVSVIYIIASAVCKGTAADILLRVFLMLASCTAAAFIAKPRKAKKSKALKNFKKQKR